MLSELLVKLNTLDGLAYAQYYILSQAIEVPRDNNEPYNAIFAIAESIIALTSEVRKDVMKEV